MVIGGIPTPDGRILSTVSLPVSQPTSCAFGGRNLDTLYVTSSRQRMSADAIAICMSRYW